MSKPPEPSRRCRPTTSDLWMQDHGSAKQKLFKNAIQPLILPIEIVDAVIPALHLDLAIFAWLFDHTEKELQQLDLQVAVHCAPSNEDDDQFTLLTDMRVKKSSQYAPSCRSQSRSIRLLKTNCNSLHFGESSMILAKKPGTKLLSSCKSHCEPSPDR